MDEHLLLTEPDPNIFPAASQLLDNIRDQICNVFGDFAGSISTDVDFILEYIQNSHAGNDDIIRNFEIFCSENDLESEYDIITQGLIDIFKSYLGVNIDISRENMYFSDLYDIYCVFVISLKNTLILSTKNHYIKNGIAEENIKPDAVREYCLSDEFSATDSFIRNAADFSADVALINLKNKVDDFTLSINQEVFVKFIYDYIIANDIKIEEVV